MLSDSPFSYRVFSLVIVFERRCPRVISLPSSENRNCEIKLPTAEYTFSCPIVLNDAIIIHSREHGPQASAAPDTTSLGQD